MASGSTRKLPWRTVLVSGCCVITGLICLHRRVLASKVGGWRVWKKAQLQIESEARSWNRLRVGWGYDRGIDATEPYIAHQMVRQCLPLCAHGLPYTFGSILNLRLRRVMSLENVMILSLYYDGQRFKKL